MKNKEYLLAMLFLVFLCITACSSIDRIQKKEEKPNIIYIYTDQQSANMMKCSGNECLKTPEDLRFLRQSII